MLILTQGTFDMKFKMRSNNVTNRRYGIQKKTQNWILIDNLNSPNDNRQKTNERQIKSKQIKLIESIRIENNEKHT